MAEAVASGAREVADVEATLLQVPELVPDEILEKSGAKAARRAFAHIPLARVEQLPDADAIIFGTPTRFGNMAAQMRNFLDQTGGLWARGALVRKVGSVFTGTATQHGGQETTITSFHSTLLHQGMIIVRRAIYRPGSEQYEGNHGWNSLWGFNTSQRRRLPAALGERLEIARFQGRHMAEIAKRLKG